MIDLLFQIIFGIIALGTGIIATWHLTEGLKIISKAGLPFLVKDIYKMRRDILSLKKRKDYDTEDDKIINGMLEKTGRQLEVIRKAIGEDKYSLHSIPWAQYLQMRGTFKIAMAAAFYAMCSISTTLLVATW